MADHDHEPDLPIDAWTLESLLDGGSVGNPASPGLPELGALISAARGPASPAELAGEQAARAAFVDAAATSSLITTRRRSSVLSTLIGSKIALAAAGALALSGASTAAAFTGQLPGPAQNAAHHLLGAPAADQQTDAEDSPIGEATDDPTSDPTEMPTGAPRATTTPVGPDATGSAAYGLCTAWTAQVRAGHTPNSSSVAFRNLITAAGSADNVAAYCTGVVATSHPTHPAKPTGSPSAHPTGSPTSHPTGKPSTHPTHPAKPTGSPTRSTHR